MALEDRWHRKDRTRTAEYGKGLRWRAVWSEGASPKKKSFASKDAAKAHLAWIEHTVKFAFVRLPDLPEDSLDTSPETTKCPHLPEGKQGRNDAFQLVNKTGLIGPRPRCFLGTSWCRPCRPLPFCLG